MFKRGLFVGAPKDDTKAVNSGLIIEYNKGLETTKGWEKISEQVDLVDPNSIQQNYLYDVNNNKTVGFVDWIDPIKGKLPGPASAELKFLADHDPAVYSDVKITGTTAEQIEKQVENAPVTDCLLYTSPSPRD